MWWDFSQIWQSKDLLIGSLLTGLVIAGAIGILLPSGILRKKFWKKATTGKVIATLLGLLIGLVCMVGGTYLFLQGVTRSGHWVATSLGREGAFTDAPPGGLLFFVGLIIWLLHRDK